MPSAVASPLGYQLVIKATAIGSVAGPSADWAGERLKAIEIVGSAPLTYLAIALIWTVALQPLLISNNECLLESWKPGRLCLAWPCQINRVNCRYVIVSAHGIYSKYWSHTSLRRIVPGVNGAL